MKLKRLLILCAAVACLCSAFCLSACELNFPPPPYLNGGTGETTPPDEGETTPPDEGETTPPDEGETTPPDEGETTPPDEGETTPPDEGATTSPDEGETTPPDEGETTPPDEGETTPPDEGETTPPDEGETTSPDEGETTPPDEGETTSPDEGETTPPDEGETTPPEEEESEPIVPEVVTISAVKSVFDRNLPGVALNPNNWFTLTVNGEQVEITCEMVTVGWGATLNYDSPAEGKYTVRASYVANDGTVYKSSAVTIIVEVPSEGVDDGFEGWTGFH